MGENVVLKYRLILTGILVGLIIGLPLFAAQTGPRYGGTLKMGTQFDGASIGYPAKLVAVFYSQKQATPAVETLFRTDKTGRPVPWLSTGAKENAKAQTVTISLRKNVKFHDGTDFNAEAVKWNLDQCMASKSEGTEKFKSIDVVDEYTVRITLSEWDNTVLSTLTQSVGMMVSPSACKKNGVEWAAKNPVGTGPFQFVSWERDVRTIYKKFPGYWQKGKPYLDGVEYIPINDSLTRLLSFKKGELDFVEMLAPKDLADLKKEGYPVIYSKMGSGVYNLIPDSANPNSPFADVRVRQAAQYAIDTVAIAQTVFYGQVEPANQYIYKGHWGYNAAVKGYPYNPIKAKQLLAAAGYPSGFKTKLLYRANPQDDQVYTAVQGYLSAVGINVQLDPAQTGRYNQIFSQGGAWDGLIVGGWNTNPDVAGAFAMRLAGGGKYFSQMLLPNDYLKTIGSAVTARSFNEKQKAVKEVMKLMVDKYCLQIELYCPSGFASYQPSLHNHGFHDTPNTASWTPEDAWLEK